MQIRFIAHAGFAIEEDGTTVLIDPWFYSSTHQEPVLLGILPPNRTIDFQIPPCLDVIENFKASAVLVSHFHTHHAPLREIRQLVQQSTGAEFVFGMPWIQDSQVAQILENLQPQAERVKVLRLQGDNLTFNIGPFTITAFTTTYLQHCTWLIQSKTGAFLHIADAQINRNSLDRRLDQLWYRFANLQPDLVAISAAGHNLKHESQGRKWLHENSTFSPVEAARLLQMIKPKQAALMGVFNHSAWTKSAEHALPGPIADELFRWACGYLVPDMQCLSLNPQMQIQTNSPRTIHVFDDRSLQLPTDLFN